MYGVPKFAVRFEPQGGVTVCRVGGPVLVHQRSRIDDLRLQARKLQKEGYKPFLHSDGGVATLWRRVLPGERRDQTESAPVFLEGRIETFP